jgi:hypothetical protein
MCRGESFSGRNSLPLELTAQMPPALDVVDLRVQAPPWLKGIVDRNSIELKLEVAAALQLMEAGRRGEAQQANANGVK